MFTSHNQYFSRPYKLCDNCYYRCFKCHTITCILLTTHALQGTHDTRAATVSNNNNKNNNTANFYRRGACQKHVLTYDGSALVWSRFGTILQTIARFILSLSFPVNVDLNLSHVTSTLTIIGNYKLRCTKILMF